MTEEEKKQLALDLDWIVLDVFKKVFAGRIFRRAGEVTDYLQEGRLALFMALDKFDEKRGAKLSTFLWKSVLVHMAIYRRTAGIIRTPREPGKLKGVRSRKQVIEAKKIVCYGGFRPNREGRKNWAEPEHPSSQTPFREIDEREEPEPKDVVQKLLTYLPERYRKIIIWYFFEGFTLEAIGKREGVSKERIRQLVEKSLGLMKKKAGEDTHWKERI